MGINPMRKVILLCSMSILLLWSQGCSKTPSTAPAKPKVAGTIFPLFDIARNIVGDKMDAVQILPPGASPHTFELTPQQVRQLQGGKVIFKIGHGLDDWTNTIADVLPDAKMVVVDKGIKLIYSGGEEEHGGANPHYWLSLSNGMIIAKNIEEEAAKLDPQNEVYYKTNLDAYLAKLEAAEKEIAGKLGNLPNKNLITFHDAWVYFAEEFGLKIVGNFEPSPGKQPTPRDMAELEQKVRQYHIKAVFSEPELSSAAIEPFVKDMGVKLYVLYPLEGLGGQESYIAVLEYNADIIAKALLQ